jgi:hypothetical protein
MRRREVEQTVARVRLLRWAAAVGAVGTMIVLVIVGAGYGLGYYVAATSRASVRQVTPTVAGTPTPTLPPVPAGSPWHAVWQRAGTAPFNNGVRGINLTPPPISTLDDALAPGQHVLLAWSCNAATGLPPAATFLQVSIMQNGKSLPVDSRVCPGYGNATLTAATSDATADISFGTLALDVPWSVALELPAGSPWGFAVEVPNH